MRGEDWTAWEESRIGLMKVMWIKKHSNYMDRISTASLDGQWEHLSTKEVSRDTRLTHGEGLMGKARQARASLEWHAKDMSFILWAIQN